jgi:MFS transporter, DHA1 family, inner membrane transport protein
VYGVGALGGVIGGWLGERLGRVGVLACLLVLAASGFALFNLAVSASAHAALSLLFGLMISGFLFARLMAMLQLSAHPDRIGAVVAFGLGGFYTPGPFAGYLFGKLRLGRCGDRYGRAAGADRRRSDEPLRSQEDAGRLVACVAASQY